MFTHVYIEQNYIIMLSINSIFIYDINDNIVCDIMFGTRCSDIEMNEITIFIIIYLLICFVHKKGKGILCDLFILTLKQNDCCHKHDKHCT